jgi:hypothetical protein
VQSDMLNQASLNESSESEVNGPAPFGTNLTRFMPGTEQRVL